MDITLQQIIRRLWELDAENQMLKTSVQSMADLLSKTVAEKEELKKELDDINSAKVAEGLAIAPNNRKEAYQRA